MGKSGLYRAGVMAKQFGSRDIRELSVADLSGCLELSGEQGWNQSESDWRLMLECGTGFGIFADDALVGSALVLPYPPSIAWISMVIVCSDYRRRGLATQLMMRCLEYADERGLTAFLDASADGKPVYERLGFAERGMLTRYAIPSAESSDGDHQKKIPHPVRQQIATMDSDALGGDRSRAMKQILNLAPGLCDYSLGSDGNVSGFVTCRRGRTSVQIGPVVARGFEESVAMIETVIGRISAPAILDIPHWNQQLIAHASAEGWEKKRSFVRMSRSANEVDTLSGFCAVAGPALG